jgi:hypothetical protein
MSQVQLVNQFRAVNTLPIVDAAVVVSAVAVVDFSVVAAVVDRRPSTKTKEDKKADIKVEADTEDAAPEPFEAVIVDAVVGAVAVEPEVETMRKVADSKADAVAVSVALEDAVHIIVAAAAIAVVDAAVAAVSIKAAKKEPANLKVRRKTLEMLRTEDVVADAVAVDAEAAVVDAVDHVAVPVPKSRAKEAERTKLAARARLWLTGQPKRSEQEGIEWEKEELRPLWLRELKN